MVASGRARARRNPVVQLVRDALHPEGTVDEGTRRAFAEEATESNVVTVRWLALFLAPLHAIVVAVFHSFHETDPNRIAWVAGLTTINAALFGVDLLGLLVCWRRRPALLLGAMGDFGGAVYILAGAAMAANAQRANPNVNLFVISAFFAAFRLRMRTQIFVPSVLAGAALVLAGVVRFRPEAAQRSADYLTLLCVTALSLFAFFLARGMRLREVQARREIQHLNAQLNDKIQERSRELSMALACLAESYQESAPGTVLGGRAELDLPIGRGGMGIVYRGRDRLTGKVVAVKVVQAGSMREMDALHRFLREAQIVASITHPAIVRSVHVDVSEEGRLFQMMELVEGETLEARLARAGALDPRAAARLGQVLAEALAAAHEAAVAHLDVKPANVILTRAKPGLKLLDFGISKLRGVRAVHGGNEGRILGTPEFLAPEQVDDPAHADERADVYALGLVLYRSIAGRMPFDAASPPAWLLAHTTHPPLDLAAIVPRLDPGLAEIVMSCLAKDPGARPTASAVAAALAKITHAAAVPALENLGLVASVPPPPMSSDAQSGAVATTQASMVKAQRAGG